MNEFFKRRGAKVEPGDLKRFIKILLDDVGYILDGHELRVHLLDSEKAVADLGEPAVSSIRRGRVCSEAESGRVFLPVFWDQKPLALIQAAPRPGKALSDEAVALLPTVVRMSLEKMLLYKINVTDSETGLNNDDFFNIYLKRCLEPFASKTAGRDRIKPLKLTDSDDQAGLTVLFAEFRDFDRLRAEHGRQAARTALMDLAERFGAMAPTPNCAARLDRGRMGFIVQKIDSGTAKALAGQIAEDYMAFSEFRDFGPVFGVAGFPDDHGEDLRQSGSEDATVDDLAAVTTDRAELALHQALSDPGRVVYSFRDVLKRGGRVVQALPYNRVVVNLGRMVGAREGRIFTLIDAGKSDDSGYKGEVVLFDVQEDFSVGEVVDLKNSLTRVNPGDRLLLGGKSREEGAGDGEGGGPDPVLGIPGHHGFVKLLAGFPGDSGGPCSVVLIRVDGYDKYRKTMGHLESDKQLKALYELLQREIPEGGRAGRFSADSLAVLLPGIDTDGARALAEQWRDAVAGGHRQTCSFGVASYPCGDFDPSDMIANAQKALEHAEFLGESAVAAFDSVSLNISGDKMFETGDWEGAMAEYHQALALNPEDLNVLNSLGVCYGYGREYEKALDTFDRVLAKDANNLMAHYNRGFVLSMDQRYDEAVECFRVAAGIDPNNFDVLFHWGKMALELGRIEEAASIFEKAARLEKPNPIVFRYLAQTLLQLDRKREAVDAYKAAVRYDPNDASSMSQLGVLYLESGRDLEVALSLVQQSVDLDPTNGLFRQRLARTMVAMDLLMEAEKEYRRALEMGVGSREAYFELGCLILDLGKKDEAAEFFNKALAVDPEFKPATDALNGIQGEFEE